MTAADPSVVHVRPTPAEDLWRWCDRLTLPRRHRLERETGGTEWLEIPSIVAQLEEDLQYAGGDSGSRSKPGSRAPLNVTVLSLLGEMSTVIIDAIVGEDLNKRDTLSGMIRQLTAHLVSTSPDELGWWTRLFKGWVDEGQACLPSEEHGPATRGIRGFQCPDCGTGTVTRISEGETFRDPAVVLQFREGQVRNATCLACGRHWFRGEQLAGMTDVLPALDSGRWSA